MGTQNNPFSLSEKTIIVTGASSGIGRQCAISCSNSGARVVLMGRDQERLNGTLELMKNGEHIISRVDLLDFDEIEHAIVKIIANTGKLNGLINCAGVSTTLPFSQSKPEKMESFFRTNVIGPMNLTRLILKKDNFSDKGGSIIFISSVMGSAGETGKHLYSMTKGAIDAGVRSLAVEFASKKIRINSISPGVVITPMSQNAVYSRDEDSLNKVKALHPLGLGYPEDVANSCIYLLSDASKWVTGSNLIIDGGFLAK